MGAPSERSASSMVFSPRDVDDVVLASDVERCVAGLSPAPPLATVTGAGHFFHGHLAELRQAVQAAVR